MRTILLGMNNPLSRDERLALCPKPAGSAGGRLLAMLRTQLPDVSTAQYLRAFERHNLLLGEWAVPAAVEAGRWFRALVRDGRAESTVVVLGAATWSALALPPAHPPILPLVEPSGDVWRLLPHPSGRNRWYNDPDNRLVAGLLLAELYERSLK